MALFETRARLSVVKRTPRTAELWSKQDQHQGDRWLLFTAIAYAIDAKCVFYPGCFVDISPSFLFESVTYLDTDKRAQAFFADVAGIREIVDDHNGPSDPEITFIRADYTERLDLPEGHFDLLVSLYAGFVSEHCTQYLRLGGTLLVNSSHGDVGMASIDPRYELVGVVSSRAGNYRVDTTDLDRYLIPKKPQAVTIESLHNSSRGIAYTKTPFAYLFVRVA